MGGFQDARLQALRERAGTYAGEGMNHEDAFFSGLLELRPVVGGRGLSIAFTATGEDGTLLHEEHTTVAPGPLGSLVLATLGSNAPELLLLELRRDAPFAGSERTLRFGMGDPERQDAFRLELSIDLWRNGDLGYRYAWGLPGGAFEDRSGVRLRRQT